MSSDKSALLSIIDEISAQTLPPVHAWHPATTRDVDIRIARNGDWYHAGSRIERLRMVKLFASVLRIDDGQTYLVTPQERLRIIVDEAPFTAVLLEQHGAPESKTLVFTTNLGERVVADELHCIEVKYRQSGGEPTPYLHVRDQLHALISRAVFYQLADLAEEREGVIGVESAGVFMPLSEPEHVNI